MNFNLAKMLVLSAFMTVFAQAAFAVPLSVTIWEKSGTGFSPTAHKFLWNDSKLNVVLNGTLSAGNSDFQSVDGEYYDVVRFVVQGGAIDDATGIYIRGQSNTAQGFNIARVDINMSNNTTYYFSSVDAYEMSNNGVANSELNAVDDNLATATTFGSVGEMSLMVGTPKFLNPPPNLCCPPWNQARLAEMMAHKYGSGIPGSYLSTYTLKFQPTKLFKREMQGYIEQLNAIDPTIYMIIIDWALYDQGPGNIPMGWAGGSSPGNNGTKIGANYFRTWQANGASTSIEPLNSTPDFFPDRLMRYGRWYLIHTGIYLNNNKKFFANSCADNDIYVRRWKLGVGLDDFLEVRDVYGKLLDKY